MNEVRTEEETSLVVTEPVLVEEMQRPSRRADGGYDSADDDDAENDAEEGKLLETIGESAVCFVTTGRHSPTTLLFQRLFLQLLHRGGRFSHRNRANHARRRADGFLEQGGTRVLFPHAKRCTPQTLKPFPVRQHGSHPALSHSLSLTAPRLPTLVRGRGQNSRLLGRRASGVCERK